MTVLGVIGGRGAAGHYRHHRSGHVGGQPDEHRYNILRRQPRLRGRARRHLREPADAEKQRQDALTQQQYDNTASERAYQDALKQQAFNNNVTTQKLNIAKGEWALKQANAQQKAAQARQQGSGCGHKVRQRKNHRQQRLCFRWPQRRQRRGATQQRAAAQSGQERCGHHLCPAAGGATPPAQIAKIIQEMNK